jgi:hypothetical protein
VDQYTTEELPFSLVHADMNGQDFVRTPGWHTRSDEYATGADVVAGSDQSLCRGADSVLCQAMCGGDAAVDALLRCIRREAFGGERMVRPRFGCRLRSAA